MIKERVCACYHRLPFKQMPLLLLVAMVEMCGHLTNFFPLSAGISDTYSPLTIVEKIQVDQSELRVGLIQAIVEEGELCIGFIELSVDKGEILDGAVQLGIQIFKPIILHREFIHSTLQSTHLCF